MVEFVNPMQEHFAPWVQKVLDGAFAVLERKGLLVPQPEVLRTLEATAGLSVRDSRVSVSPWRSSEFLGRYRACHPFQPQRELALSTGTHAHHIVDVEGTLRPIALADVEAGVRLEAAVALEDAAVAAGAPGIPQDVAPPLQALAQLLASARNKPGYPTHVPPTTSQADGYVAECLEVLGYSQSAGVHMVSPLRFEGNEVERALRMVRAAPGTSVGVGAMPVLGVSAPASVLGGFVMATAEVLGGGILFEALGTPVGQLGLWVNAYPFDMRHACFVYGSPANVVCALLEREINCVLGAEAAAKSFKTTAQHPGAQACAQKAAFTGIMAGLGKKTFSGAGSLSVDEIYSPVQLIFDREIFAYVRRTAEMLTSSLDESLLMVEEIISSQNDYMASEGTVQNFRALQWDSEVFPSRMLAQWQAAGCPLEEQAAVKEIRRLLDGYGYHLPEDKARALEGIYVRAARDLGG